MPIILKLGHKLDKTYYKAICPECNLIGAFKETEAATKLFYPNGSVNLLYFYCPNCNHIIEANANDRIKKEDINSIIKGDAEI